MLAVLVGVAMVAACSSNPRVGAADGDHIWWEGDAAPIQENFNHGGNNKEAIYISYGYAIPGVENGKGLVTHNIIMMVTAGPGDPQYITVKSMTAADSECTDDAYNTRSVWSGNMALNSWAPGTYWVQMKSVAKYGNDPDVIRLSPGEWVTIVDY